MHPDEIRLRLSQLIEERHEDYAGLSRLLGRNAAYVQQYVKRGVPRVLSEADRRKLARYFGIDDEEFGLEPIARLTGTSLIPVPRFDIGASAGHGAFADREAANTSFAFSAAWLESVTGSRPRDLSIIRVEGDSMSPTLNDGDDIMVDRSAATRPIQDGVHVIRRDDTLLVKRISLHPARNLLTISSDNPAYARWPDCAPDDVNIVGRVVWAGRRLR